jgi:cytochrome c oxidase subunit 2
MPQARAALLFGLGALVLAAAILFVGRRARSGPAPADEVTHAGYRVRRVWFATLLIAAVAALVVSLPFMPYPQFRLTRLARDVEPLTVRLEAQQWAWVMEPEEIPSGRPIRFEVTSIDVNHDFAIYDADDHILAQVQAMPGYTNTLVVRFDEPGTYWIRCLELCGLMHHAMVRAFEVT